MQRFSVFTLDSTLNDSSLCKVLILHGDSSNSDVLIICSFLSQLLCKQGFHTGFNSASTASACRLSWTLINRMRVQFSQRLRSTTERRSQLELHFAGSSDVSNLQ